jgi:hypothetical protein
MGMGVGVEGVEGVEGVVLVVGDRDRVAKSLVVEMAASGDLGSGMITLTTGPTCENNSWRIDAVVLGWRLDT